LPDFDHFLQKRSFKTPSFLTFSILAMLYTGPQSTLLTKKLYSFLFF